MSNHKFVMYVLDQPGSKPEDCLVYILLWYWERLQLHSRSYDYRAWCSSSPSDTVRVEEGNAILIPRSRPDLPTFPGPLQNTRNSRSGWIQGSFQTWTRSGPLHFSRAHIKYEDRTSAGQTHRSARNAAFRISSPAWSIPRSTLCSLLIRVGALPVVLTLGSLPFLLRVFDTADSCIITGSTSAMS